MSITERAGGRWCRKSSLWRHEFIFDAWVEVKWACGPQPLQGFVLAAVPCTAAVPGAQCLRAGIMDVLQAETRFSSSAPWKSMLSTCFVCCPKHPQGLSADYTSEIGVVLNLEWIVSAADQSKMEIPPPFSLTESAACTCW